MMNLKELERRALLGDRKAQIKLAKEGIALSCPKCGKSCTKFETVAEACALIPGDEAYESLKGFYAVVCDTNRGGCGLFVCGSGENSEIAALIEWNERPAPPVGCCGDCANWYKGHCASSGPCAAEETDADFYCPNFEPKEG